MIYVLPIPKELRNRFLNYSRLYAFPNLPEPLADDSFVILDSGAFGLSKSRGQRSMSVSYMHRLAEHYKAHGKARIFCIAPDVFLDPEQTMRQWLWWHKHDFPSVVPVIQFKEQKKVDLHTLVRQCIFYRSWRPEFVCISNPFARGVEVQTEMTVALKIVRDILSPSWVHCLGAGWSPEDIAIWRKMGFDSIDSIAYYTSAQAGESWTGVQTQDWHNIAEENAKVAQLIARNSHSVACYTPQ